MLPSRLFPFAVSEIAASPHSSSRPAPRRLGAADLLRVSRVGLIVSHLWAYLLPALQGGGAPGWQFWVGALYVTVPLGLLIYGWNDYFDADVDALSVRKSDRATSAVFGPRLAPRQRAALPFAIVAAQLPFALLWAVTGELRLVAWMALMALANALYNGPGLRLSRVPVLAELTATGIYMLIFWLGAVTAGPAPAAWLWVFAAMSILILQIAGTLVDREADGRVGKRTFSVAFGAGASRAAMALLAAAKAALTWAFSGNLAATAVMGLGLALVTVRFSLRGWRPSSTSYSLFIVLDWIWLGLLAVA